MTQGTDGIDLAVKDSLIWRIRFASERIVTSAEIEVRRIAASHSVALGVVVVRAALDGELGVCYDHDGPPCPAYAGSPALPTEK